MSDHVEVLRHMKETIKAIMPSEVAALDAAIAALSAPQPPSGGESDVVVQRLRGVLQHAKMGDKYLIADDLIHKAIDAITAPPSAPVGVEAPADEFNGDTPHLIRCIESLLRLDAAGALVPHGVGGHARTMLAAAAKRLAQQPAAVDGAAVKRAVAAVMSAPAGISVEAYVRIALEAALAAQPGGSDND